MTPEARRELLDHLTRACVLWTEDVMKGYFDDPRDTMSQQMVLEAYAGAITTIANRLPNRKAVLKTFLIELQDLVNKEPK
jgi:hypothetical protein